MEHRDDSVGFLIVDLARLFRQRFERAIAEEGLDITAGEAKTLLHASEPGGLRQAALAERMGVEPMTLSDFLDRLEARGLVARMADPADRRAKRVVVTDAGRPLLDRIRTVAASVRECATSGLTNDQAAAMRSALIVMRGNLAADARERAA